MLPDVALDAQQQPKESESMFGVIYSVVAYVGFLASFAYLAFFSAGVLVPKHVDTGLAAGMPAAVLVNTTLLLLFGLQHSTMARPTVKRFLGRLVPAGLERATFVLASDAVLVLLLWQWRPLPHALWEVEAPLLRLALWALCGLGWVGAVLSSFMIDHLELVGVKQALATFRRKTFARRGFVTPLFYRYVRHPMMSCLLLGFWATPHLSAGHALLAAGMSAYIFVGVHCEEQSLLRELGDDYQRYRATTPRFLPGARATAGRSATEPSAGTEASVPSSRTLT